MPCWKGLADLGEARGRPVRDAMRIATRFLAPTRPTRWTLPLVPGQSVGSGVAGCLVVESSHVPFF